MLNIVCAGIDYSISSIEIREKFSLTKNKQIEFYEYLRKNDGILGAVIISTCNRMELCLSLAKNYDINPFELVYNFLELQNLQISHKIYKNDDMISHLCFMSCGAISQIFGEDQIISQVKNSINFSRENKMTDSLLEVVFRTSIACAKKVKTDVNLNKRETSIADFVIENMKNKPINNVLVIGNGEMGRYMTKKLLENQYNVHMSLRQYRYGEIKVPKGCNIVNYSEIFDRMSEFSAVISATLSPHFTISYERFSEIENYPKFLYDLAVPRDIDPNISKIKDVYIYDVDTLSFREKKDKFAVEIKEIEQITQKYLADFYKWYNFKNKL